MDSTVLHYKNVKGSPSSGIKMMPEGNMDLYQESGASGSNYMNKYKNLKSYQYNQK